MNPELRRNLWLEFSLHRMLAAPLLIALVVVLVLAFGAPGRFAFVAGLAGAGFCVTVLFWGTQRAGMSVLEETQERTWDQQRMSAIGPWAMTWGKLLGAPSFTWYCGSMTWLLFVLAGWTSLSIPVGTVALSMLAGAIMLHAAALSGSIFAARKGVARRGGGLGVAALLLLVIAVPSMQMAQHYGAALRWWHEGFSSDRFMLAALCAYAAWAVLGAYRSMCGELGLRTLPWALPAFIVFSALFLAGFAADARHGGEAALVLLLATMLSLALAYPMLLGEGAGAPGAWQRLRAHWRAGQARRLWQELPLWLVALACGLAFAIGSAFAPRASNDASDILQGGLFPLALALFALRDAAILQFFALARHARRAEAAGLFYLLLLYLLLPGLLGVLGLDRLAEFVRPAVLEDSGFACAVLAVQAAMALALAWWRWSKVHATDAAAP